MVEGRAHGGLTGMHGDPSCCQLRYVDVQRMRHTEASADDESATPCKAELAQLGGLGTPGDEHVPTRLPSTPKG